MSRLIVVIICADLVFVFIQAPRVPLQLRQQAANLNVGVAELLGQERLRVGRKRAGSFVPPRVRHVRISHDVGERDTICDFVQAI